MASRSSTKKPRKSLATSSGPASRRVKESRSMSSPDVGASASCSKTVSTTSTCFSEATKLHMKMLSKKKC